MTRRLAGSAAKSAVITASTASSPINSAVLQLPPRPGTAPAADTHASNRYTTSGSCQIRTAWAN